MCAHYGYCLLKPALSRSRDINGQSEIIFERHLTSSKNTNMISKIDSTGRKNSKRIGSRKLLMAGYIMTAGGVTTTEDMIDSVANLERQQ
jgi:hypothetical protein